MRIDARSARIAMTAPLARTWRRWSRSMLLRVVFSTMVLGLGVVAMLGAYVTNEIRDGLVETRVERILSESARDVSTTQRQINASTSATPGELQFFVDDLLRNLQAVGGDARGLVLLRVPTNDSAVSLAAISTSPEEADVITEQMRIAVHDAELQSWQHVELPVSGEPGLVVGNRIDIGEAGPYELYFVYSLEDERHTLSLIQQVLGLGAGVLVVLVVLMTWSVALQTVRPVRHAARVAARLTEGRLSERMKVRGHDEMATLASTFNEMAGTLQRQITRMEDLSRLQRRFVSDVSHELRTPLTTMRMASDILHDARQSFPPEVARSAELLNNQIDRFEALLSDLLEISRIDAGAAQLEFEETNVADVVRDEVEAMAASAHHLGVEVRLWVAPGGHVASIDRPRCGRIVRNLLANALEHADVTSGVDVVVGSNARAAAVVVRDYGMGLTAQQVERVFDRFWRADSARARTMGGTGLGLSIAREDAQLHGGRLEAWGQPSQGASFRLLLPRTSRGLGTHDPLPLMIRPTEVAAWAERGEMAAIPVAEVDA